MRLDRIVAVALALAAPAASAATAPVDFNRDVRPILSDHCFKCHGPDERTREARLRLDVRESALVPAKSGLIPIVPGKPDESELLARLTDAHEPMPPAETGKKLAAAQIATLRRWVAEGAPYAPHWAFVAPVQARVSPAGDIQKSSSDNPIDAFVRAKLSAHQLAPARAADAATLFRRVSLDLTGVPPTLAELDAFLADRAPGAYERAVDRLLASSRYGERMAVEWLDAARYADTNGFFGDAGRQAWPWRDWVINAFNRNLPYDRFTIEQLAGDLLPSPTLEQRIATGFNRNHTMSNESGLIDEEYRVEYVADRAETTATVFLGLTLGCARCHDHKYDPISQRDYYSLFAFFNNTVESGLIKTENPPPVMDVTTPAQQAEAERLAAARKAAETAFAAATKPLAAEMAAWEKDAAAAELQPPTRGLVAHVDFEPEAAADSSGSPPPARTPALHEQGNIYRVAGLAGQAGSFDGMQHAELPGDLPLSADRPFTVGIWLKGTGSLNGVMAKTDSETERRGFEVIWNKGWIKVNLVNRWVASAIEVQTKDAMKSRDWNHVVVSYDGSGRAAGLRIFTDGAQATLEITRDNLSGSTATTAPLKLGRRDSGLGFNGQLDEFRLYDRAVGLEEARAWYWAERLHAPLATAPAKRDARQNALLLDYFVERHGRADARAARTALAAARTTEDNYRATLPKTLVMHEAEKRRDTHILMRGQYDQHGALVTADTPAALPAFLADAPRNRLGLAQWIVAPGNPLAARVAVNRFWQKFFGEGLVSTPNDFGSQGDAPSHPELLDWLAADFARTWDMKALVRLIVTSATYRQDSAPTRALLERDPDNRWLARGPRFRLGGEMLRDQALAISGLLVERLGGPPVKPYQPPGLWEAVSFNGDLTYERDKGDDLWRRSVYTYWKRSAPPADVQLFDGPTRESCTVRRPRTNTPLQALVLLNDDTYVEAARALAAKALAAASAPSERAAHIFRRATSRPPSTDESATLVQLATKQLARFRADPAAAKKLLAVGESPRGRNGDPAEMAAWTLVAQAVLNLDEVITRR